LEDALFAETRERVRSANVRKESDGCIKNSEKKVHDMLPGWLGVRAACFWHRYYSTLSCDSKSAMNAYTDTSSHGDACGGSELEMYILLKENKHHRSKKPQVLTKGLMTGLPDILT
jgi:hypothetical protein